MSEENKECCNHEGCGCDDNEEVSVFMIAPPDVSNEEIKKFSDSIETVPGFTHASSLETIRGCLSHETLRELIEDFLYADAVHLAKGWETSPPSTLIMMMAYSMRIPFSEKGEDLPSINAVLRAYLEQWFSIDIDDEVPSDKQ
jgi:hypothetical protein